MIDDGLTPDKLAAAIERLEAEKRRRAEGKPAAPEVPTSTQRVFANPEDNPIITRPAPPAPRKARPKPRKAAKPARLTPVPFFIYTSKPLGGDAGSIEEGFYTVRGGEVFLCDAAGTVTGEGRKVEERGGAWTARQMLRDRRLLRPNEPYRGKLNYPPLKY